MLGRREGVVAEIARIFRQRIPVFDDAFAVGGSAFLDRLGDQLDRIDAAGDPPQQRVVERDLGLEQPVDQFLALRRQLAGGIVAAALVADGIDLLPVGGLLDQAGDFARGHRRMTDERNVPVHRRAGVEHPRFHAGRDAPDHDDFGAGVFGAQHVRRHVGLGRIDIGLIDHVGAVLLERRHRRADRGHAITGGVADHGDLLHLEDLEAIVADGVVPLAVRRRHAERVREISWCRSGFRRRRDECSASWRAP